MQSLEALTKSRDVARRLFDAFQRKNDELQESLEERYHRRRNISFRLSIRSPKSKTMELGRVLFLHQENRKACDLKRTKSKVLSNTAIEKAQSP